MAAVVEVAAVLEEVDAPVGPVDADPADGLVVALVEARVAGVRAGRRAGRVELPVAEFVETEDRVRAAAEDDVEDEEEDDDETAAGSGSVAGVPVGPTSACASTSEKDGGVW